jgi:creatinine amidohydrolase/Fe(II)-dependent formamide hydrolase-like protein
MTALSAQGAPLTFTGLLAAGKALMGTIEQQEGSAHTDEIKTSMMLYIDVSSVDTRKAAKDCHPAEVARCPFARRRLTDQP